MSHDLVPTNLRLQDAADLPGFTESELPEQGSLWFYRASYGSTTHPDDWPSHPVIFDCFHADSSQWVWVWPCSTKEHRSYLESNVTATIETGQRPEDDSAIFSLYFENPPQNPDSHLAWASKYPTRVRTTRRKVKISSLTPFTMNPSDPKIPNLDKLDRQSISLISRFWPDANHKEPVLDDPEHGDSRCTHDQFGCFLAQLVPYRVQQPVM